MNTDDSCETRNSDTAPPALSEPSSSALATAQAVADATAKGLTDYSLSYAERQTLADQLRHDTAAVRDLTVHPEHDWTTHQAYRAAGDDL